MQLLVEDAQKLYDERENELGEELMRALERFLLLQIIDQRWREHLYDMDYLREGIHLRGFAQIEPIVAYKNEAFTLFQDLMNASGRTSRGWSTTSRSRSRAQNGDGALPDAAARGRRRGGAGVLRRHATRTSRAPTATPRTRTSGPAPTVVEQRRVDENEQLGRNDPCWCGSGKKFKKCHGA